MKHLLIGAAVAGLAICPLHAQGKGHGQGGGPGNDGHGPAMHGPAMNGPSMNGPSMHGPSMRGPSMEPGGHGHPGHGPGAMPPAMRAAMPAHGKGNGHGPTNHGVGQNSMSRMNAAPRGHAAMAPRKQVKPEQSVVRAGGKAQAAPGKAEGLKVLPDGRHYYAERGARPVLDQQAARHGLIDGCPPGLAKKNNGCQPPGLARQRSYQPAWWGLSNLGSGPYVYDDGYLLRLNGGSVASYLPLLGGALSVGNIWPSTYAPVAVPDYYVDYYDLGPAGGYRYADNVLYRVDPSTSAINSIAALLTGDTFNIGSPLPDGYDVYNVPYGYRSQYVDGPDAWYRYSDGYIYQVDPTTRLVTAAIDLLTR